ncbi:MAG: LPS assembly protein LptD, partial [Sinobacteraceae bacterium]|nr:LPS assembly protein LptD [Nevskiaceae bacterium]
ITLLSLGCITSAGWAAVPLPCPSVLQNNPPTSNAAPVTAMEPATPPEASATNAAPAATNAVPAATNPAPTATNAPPATTNTAPQDTSNTRPTAEQARRALQEHKPGPSDGAVSIEAQHTDLGTDGSGTLSGNVVIRQGNREIHGDQIDYNAKDGSVRSDGGVEYQDPIVRITGTGGSYSTAAGANIRSATFDLQQRAARGSADAVQVTPQGVVDLTGVKFTTCPLADEAWSIRARSVTLDTQKQSGNARSARVELEGVPLIYLPWLSFPLSSERKSGFLFPTVGVSSRSGAELYVPYYWNIAPNADLTFEPILYSRRGVDLGGETRFLTSNDHGEITWDYLPSDNVFHNERDRVKLTNVLELPGNFRFAINAQTVSDSNYFVDFGQGPEGTSTAFIPQEATLTYRDEHWKIDGQLQHYQTTDYTLLDFQRPYSRLPGLSVNADYGWGAAQQLRYGFDSELVNFRRDTPRDQCHLVLGQNQCVNGWRLDALPQVSLNVAAPGYFVRPGIAWRMTQYELTGTDPNQQSAPLRTLPIASFDTGLLFERAVGSRDQRQLTLEPRMLYLYVPYRNQDQLPLFDTGIPDLDPVELYRTNRYVGADRVGDANQISLGFTSRLLDSFNGKQFLSATFGQIFYFSNPRVLLPAQLPAIPGAFTPLPGEIARTDNRSDFVAQLALTAYRHWSANLGLQWNPQNSQSERTQIDVQYKPDNNAVINLGYRYQRDLLTQAEISGAWPITPVWNIFARGVYSFKDGKPLERFAGFEYRSCCWKVRLGGRSFVSTRTGAESTGVYLQLELTGLASVGSASDAFLTEAIRGYAPTDSATLRARPP